MIWIDLIENDYNSYPEEGYIVLISDGDHFDTAYFIKSGEYVWMKEDVLTDESYEFKAFIIKKYAYKN